VKVFSFRNLRILVLLSLLALAAVHTKQQRLASTSWLAPVQLVVYPIAGDGSAATRRYMDVLDEDDFSAIERFMDREAARYRLIEPHPVDVRLGPEIEAMPPPPPWEGGMVETMLWSLSLRLWAWRHDRVEDDAPEGARVRMYVIYQQGDEPGGLQHSLGLRKGLIGVVHAYALAEQTPENNLVIVHELLHTLGATDKYDARGQPVYPRGYADPTRSPLHPQERAEIMAGKIPVTPDRWQMPESLHECVVGKTTAREIGWLDEDR
jgi:hypothetical protein